MDMVTAKNPDAANTAGIASHYFSATRNEWLRVVLYYLLLSLIGLQFYPAWILVAVMLVNRWRTDRYYFLIELFILTTGSGFTRQVPIDIGFLFGAIGIVIYRKNPLVKKVTLFTLAYFTLILILASTSLESMRIQLLSIRYYWLIITFFIPLVTFANREFDYRHFFHVLTLHIMCICAFYVVDTFIISGSILLPGSNAFALSTFRNPYISLFAFPRHYPPGLYWLILLIPALNYGQLKLRWYHWALILLAVASSRTNSLLFALVFCWVLFRPKLKQVALYSIVAVVALTALYVVDAATGRNMRIANNIEQFTDLSNATDDEDLAEFGTGRMAQILPKWELLQRMDRQWLGFGFLHPTKSTNPVFQIQNDYYSDISRAEETATSVEVTEVQTILDMGYIGFLGQLLFYVGLFFMLRRFNGSKMYLCTVVGFEVMGFGGFAGLNGMHGAIQILGLIIGIILLQQRNSLSSEH